MARERVSSSADSSPPPAGKPWAIRDGHLRNFLEQPGEILCRCLALHVRAKGEDDLLCLSVADALHETVDGQILRADVVERCKSAAERVVAPAKDSCALQRQDIGGLFDHAQGTVRARLVAADLAAFLRREETAVCARTHLGGVLKDGLGDLLAAVAGVGAGRLAADQPQCDPFGAAGADARQALELGNETLEGFGVVNATHGTGGKRYLETKRISTPRTGKKHA